ncbi:SnoaL-4 domain containing protein [Pyrenophora tritici-repentis]|uniref:SnoaL-4 domain containing protein n=1 Tax=Pyrenophora tritici-repentis TaxID=45151 RepID=A0A317BM98_9PLEO|nr:SnoaL-4 domain-containing protein [Pyrenophora tritici-repentis]KAF7449721.1 SnoaL-4 domain containing protein [Pyrenophora tritici-repentis]KAF7570153.1 SnoaL-4 domain containing protein [Pyrenophora tritici-repentis]KAG9383347.1 SnoaL-4 domain containing protein [Pyrenophora tritici-repentis]KAI0588907.1 SnoaL-4 domain-containing protein [Pyrenophora tritici-repentis]
MAPPTAIMAPTTFLTGLSAREAVADALQRCVLGMDSNNRPLFESACLKGEDMVVIAGSIPLNGWAAIDAMMDRVFAIVTTHTVSNIRVELKSEDADTAQITAHAISYHVREEDALKQEDTSYTASSLYDIELVKVEWGLWKMKTWLIKVLWTVGDAAVLHG